jgi:hypothetical protein
VLEYMIRNAMGGRNCEDLPLSPNGRAIYPGGTPAIVVGFEPRDVAKINRETHYALVAGCFVYQTLGKPHYTKVCVILAHRIQSDEWDSVNCIVHNDAD